MSVPTIVFAGLLVVASFTGCMVEQNAAAVDAGGEVEDASRDTKPADAKRETSDVDQPDEAGDESDSLELPGCSEDERQIMAGQRSFGWEIQGEGSAFSYVVLDEEVFRVQATAPGNIELGNEVRTLSVWFDPLPVNTVSLVPLAEVLVSASLDWDSAFTAIRLRSTDGQLLFQYSGGASPLSWGRDAGVVWDVVDAGVCGYCRNCDGNEFRCGSITFQELEVYLTDPPTRIGARDEARLRTPAGEEYLVTTDHLFYHDDPCGLTVGQAAELYLALIE